MRWDVWLGGGVIFFWEVGLSTVPQVVNLPRGWTLRRGFSRAPSFPFMRILVADQISNRKTWFELDLFSQRDDVDYLDLGLLEKKNKTVVPTPWAEVIRRIAKGTYAAAFIGEPSQLWNPRKAQWRNAARFVKLCAQGPTSFRSGPLLSHLQAAKVPIAGADLSDAPIIDNSRWAILSASKVFFKRELPTNPLNAFLYTTERTQETGNINRIPYFRDNLAKLRPISLGVRNARFEQLSAYNPVKDIDVFFAGSIPNRPTRVIGLGELQRLEKDGFRVVVTSQKFTDAEYLDLAARSYVSWSPEGFGFECARTYEVAALGSVPLLKYAPIIQYAPFRAELDGLFYVHESTDIYDSVKACLHDRPKMLEMGRLARERVRAAHRYSALAEHMLTTLLGAEKT